MTRKTLGIRIIATITVLLFLLGLGQADPLSGIIASRKRSGNLIDTRTKNVTPMHKALLTQRGYIQFLRWELPVPEIEEFTFCVWVKSINLTYPHSIFSYSKDEKDRLMRAWISAYGQSVHLEINNVQIFSHPAHIQENRWYHICESWNNGDARYALWINGQRKIDGYAPKMAGHVISGKGDVVLGQEYTDFDKGLEEGIEGAVLGFNLVLASAFDSPGEYFERNKLEDSGFNGETDLPGFEAGTPSVRPYGSRSYARAMPAHHVFDRIPLPAFDYTESSLAGHTSLDHIPRVHGEHRDVGGEMRKKRTLNSNRNWGIQNNRIKPLGQQLIETTFENCEEGRGSPNIGGKLMLISWTRTPVRVFGGAIIKNSKNDCGQF